MRILLFTGKGGVGKTTTAAATAALAAARGSKTLVLSTDPAHSLADAFGVELGAEPTEIDTGLYGQQVDTQRAFEASWREVQHYLRDILEQGGVDPLEAEELTVLPGAEEVLALLELRAQVADGALGHRRRRLRADRRDAAAAGAARGAALVDAADVPARPSGAADAAPGAHPPRRPAVPAGLGLRCRRAALRPSWPRYATCWSTRRRRRCAWC